MLYFYKERCLNSICYSYERNVQKTRMDAVNYLLQILSKTELAPTIVKLDFINLNLGEIEQLHRLLNTSRDEFILLFRFGDEESVSLRLTINNVPVLLHIMLESNMVQIEHQYNENINLVDIETIVF